MIDCMTSASLPFTSKNHFIEPPKLCEILWMTYRCPERKEYVEPILVPSANVLAGTMFHSDAFTFYSDARGLCNASVEFEEQAGGCCLRLLDSSDLGPADLHPVQPRLADAELLAAMGARH